MSLIASAVLPIMLVVFIGVGLYKRVDVFNSFLIGAVKGLKSLIKIVPSIIALVLAVKLLRGSGLIDSVSNLFSPLFKAIGVPSEVLPLALLKSISGSGSTALLSDIFEGFGSDSHIGLIASVMCCSSETTFYTIAVYYGAVNIKNTRHTIFAALMADLAAVIFSIMFVNILLI